MGFINKFPLLEETNSAAQFSFPNIRSLSNSANCVHYQMQNPRSYRLHFRKALILPYPTLTIPGAQSVQLAVHKLCCTLESPGEIFKILMPSYHPIAIKSEYLRIGGRKQYFYRSLGDSGKVWELAPLCTALFMLMPGPGGKTV